MILFMKKKLNQRGGQDLVKARAVHHPDIDNEAGDCPLKNADSQKDSFRP